MKLASNAPMPQFGQIWRLVSKDGQNDLRFETGIRRLIDGFQDEFKELSPYKSFESSTKLDEFKKFIQDVHGRISSFRLQGEEWPYLVINPPQNPDPIAAQYLEKNKQLLDKSRTLFPNNIEGQTNWYCQESDKLTKEYVEFAGQRIL